MFLNVLLLFAVLLGTNGLGTKYNYFEFVELGQNGVQYQTLYDQTSYTPRIYPSVIFGGTSFSHAWVTQNGRIYFDYIGQPGAFGYYSGNDYSIAPFGDGVDSSNGHVRYEVHNDYESSPLSQQLRTDVSFYIQNVLGVSVSVESLLVVEWAGLRSSVLSSQKTNKFQALIATSSSQRRSYAIFTYKCGELQWSTQSSTIGFKAMHGQYRNHPFSRSNNSPNPIACVNSPRSSWSNVVYTIDSSVDPCSLSEFGCTDGSCIRESYRCNSEPGCVDGSYEIECNTPTSCEFSCGDGRCVSEEYRCDGEDDCSDGIDENDCSNISTGGYIGIVTAGVLTVFLFCIIIIVVIMYNVKQRNRRRAQFQRLRSQVSVRPQPTAAPYTAHFHPKPDEWYQTIEGQWVQGPPPAYTPAEGNSLVEEGNPPSGDEIELIGGFSNTAAADTEPLVASTDDSAATQQTQVEVEIEPILEQSSSTDPTSGQTETTPANEMGMASEEGNSLEGSSSDNEDTPLIES